MRFGKVNKYVLFGGGNKLLSFIDTLNEKGYKSIVFTDPRHLKEIILNTGKSFKKELSIRKAEYYSVDDVNADNKIIKYKDFSLAISFGAAWIFKKNAISLFNGRLLNCHGAILPEYRGAASYTWMILRGDRRGASLFHQIDEGIDTGDIVYKKDYIFPQKCQIPVNYENYALKKDIIFFKDFINKVKKNYNFLPKKQDDKKSTYFPRLNTYNQAFINWNWKGKDIDRFIKAFDEPYVGASTFLNRERIFLKKSRFVFNKINFHPFQSGLIYKINQNKIFIAVETGSLVISDIFGSNGAKKKINLGDRLNTPIKYLEEALNFKAIYNSNGLVDKK